MAEKEQQTAEQEIQQKLMMYQLLQGQMEELQKQGKALQIKAVEIDATLQALGGLEKAADGTDTFLPLGSGVFAPGRVAKGDVLVDAGAGIFTKKQLPDAVKSVEGKQKELEFMAVKLQQEMVAVVNRINAVGAELQNTLASKKK